jgi:hypothetical protein
MQNVESYVTERPGLAPEIQCEPLPPFDRTNLEGVRHAFQSAVPCSFRQAWLDQEAAGFSPGAVRMGWRENSLLVFAELMDMDIFNGATKLNQRTWELGDVFEFFLKSSEKASYVEFHVTPNNQRLQLCYPDGGAAEWAQKMGRLEEFLVPGESFYSMTWVESRKCRWHVLAEIPALAVCGSNAPIENTRWRFSFGRYDYTRGVAEPVISSTSPHTKPDFHREHEWGVLTFKNSLVIVN